MLIRHEKELEQMKRMNQRKEEDLVKRQALEKRALPKRIRSEMKAREMMFRESMRISMAVNPDPEMERNRLKKVRQTFIYWYLYMFCCLLNKYSLKYVSTFFWITAIFINYLYNFFQPMKYYLLIPLWPNHFNGKGTSVFCFLSIFSFNQ